MFYLFFQKYLHFTSLFNVCYSKDSSRKLSQYRFLNSGRPKNFQPSSEVEELSASGKKLLILFVTTMYILQQEEKTLFREQ